MNHTIKSLFILLTIVGALFLPHQTGASPKLEKHPTVSEIEITGLWRTKTSVVKRELLFQENEILTSQDLLLSVQRLKNLQIFSKVIPLLTLQPGNKVKLTLQFQEKWTTIPFANISGGGGTTYAYAGVYDINTFGRYIETGIQYDNWNGRHGGVAWLRAPRFLNQRLLFGVDFMKTKRVKQLYTQTAESEGSYTLDKNMLHFILKKEITSYFQVGTRLSLSRSNIIEYETNAVTDDATIQQLNRNRPHTALFKTLFVELGKLNYENYLVDGTFTTLSIKHSNPSLLSDLSITQVDWVNRVFWRLPYHANIGLRLNFGWTNTQDIQYLYNVGGFANIRGYLDGQFRNNTYWQANAEYRIPSYRSHWLVLQHIFFVDTVSTSNKLGELKNNTLQYNSAGFGLRIISPRIYSFNGRIDVAVLTSGNSPSYLSFGAQQFF